MKIITDLKIMITKKSKFCTLYFFLQSMLQIIVHTHTHKVIQFFAEKTHILQEKISLLLLAFRKNSFHIITLKKSIMNGETPKTTKNKGQQPSCS